MASVYRSVRLVILNASNAVLSVEGAQTLLGDWSPAGRPNAIAPQSAASVITQSTDLHIGVEAFLRLGSTLGHVHVAWRRPWIGDFSLDCEADPAHWKVDLIVYGEDPAAIAALLTLTAKTRRD